MKIGILSDTHDNLPMIRRAQEVFQRTGVDVLLHAGDFVAPFAVKLLLQFPGKVYAVFGNNDGEKKGIRSARLDVQEPPRRLGLGGRVIILAHSRDQVAKEAHGADVIVFGHTHEPQIEGNAPLLVNPGECGGWLSGRATVAILDTDTLTARLIELSAESEAKEAKP